MEDLINNPIKWLKELSKDRIITPDRTFIFVIDPKLSLSRIQKRKNLIPFEKVNFLEKVNNNYFNLLVGKRFKKIDATKSIDALVELCYKDILS